MSKKEKMDLTKFEGLNQNKEGLLVGGFSVTFNAGSSASLGTNDRCQTVNNCNGGNCTKGCGTDK